MGGRFGDRSLAGATFRDVNPQRASIRGASLKDVSIDETNIQGLTIFGVRVDRLIGRLGSISMRAAGSRIRRAEHPDTRDLAENPGTLGMITYMSWARFVSGEHLVGPMHQGELFGRASRGHTAGNHVPAVLHRQMTASFERAKLEGLLIPICLLPGAGAPSWIGLTTRGRCVGYRLRPDRQMCAPMEESG